MILSMTGFASASREVFAAGTPSGAPLASVSVDLRSVNSRFLDLHFRMPEELRSAEAALREGLTASLGRGKVEIRINVQTFEANARGGVNPAALETLGLLSEQVKRVFPEAQGLRVGEILRWPGVLAETHASPDALREATLAAGREAIAALVEARRREGAQLREVLLERVVAMEAIVARLQPLVPELIVRQQERIVERLREALGLIDTERAAAGTPAREELDERIRQEVTFYGIRIDVAEELSRLDAHLGETRRVLDEGGRVGKRLDFMMQELNREANTLGSKAAARELADASMALKLLIEQMREQVQNLE